MTAADVKYLAIPKRSGINKYLFDGNIKLYVLWLVIIHNIVKSPWSSGFKRRSPGKAIIKSDFSLFSLKSGFVKSLFLMFFGPGSLLEALIMKLKWIFIKYAKLNWGYGMSKVSTVGFPALVCVKCMQQRSKVRKATIFGNYSALYRLRSQDV